MLFTKFNLSLLYSFKLEVVPTSNNVNLTLLSYVSYVLGYSIDYSSTLQYSKQILASFTLIWYFLSYLQTVAVWRMFKVNKIIWKL